MKNEQSFVDFLNEESSKISSQVSEQEVPIPALDKSQDLAIDMGSERKGEKIRHSLKSCPCEKCQARRVELARKFNITTSEEAGEETGEEDFVDKEAIGKILTSIHTYQSVKLLSSDNPSLAEAWKVSNDALQTYSNMGHKILMKYLRRVDFKYKSELILGLYMGSDLAIRAQHQKQLEIVAKAERALT